MRNLNKGELRLAFVEANLLSVSCAIVLQLYHVYQSFDTMYHVYQSFEKIMTLIRMMIIMIL